MVNEYLEPLLGAFPATLSDAAAAALGECRKPTSDALSLCRSALLSNLTSAARAPDVAQALLPHITEAAGEIPRLADLSNLYQGRLQPTSLGSLTTAFLSLLFGKSLTGLTGQIAQSAALKPASAKALLEMTTAHLLPALGYNLKTANEATPAGLLQKLEAMSARWPRDTPAWLTGMSSWSQAAAAAGVAGAGLAAVTKVAHAAAGAVPSTHDAVSAGTKISSGVTSLGHQAAAQAPNLASTIPASKISDAPAAIPANLADEILASAANAKISEAITPLEGRPAVGITAIEGHHTHTVKTPSPQRAAPAIATATPARPAHHHAPAAIAAADERHDRRGGGWIWALPALLLLGTAGWWLWGDSVMQKTATAPAPLPVHKEAAPAAVAPAPARVEAPEPPAPARVATVEETETLVGPPGRTEYYGASSTFAAEVWTNPDYSAVEASPEPAPVEAAPVEAELPAPVPGHTDLYEAGAPFTADVWSNPDYTAQETAAETPPPPVAEAMAEELPPPVPGHTELYAASEPFTADVWSNPDYSAVADQATPEPEPVAETVAVAVPGHTELYEAGAPFTADVWTNADYEASTPAAEPVVENLADPVPGRTEYYEATRSFTGDVWSNPDYDAQAVEVAAAEPVPAPVPGRTEFYAAAPAFTGEVWSNPDYNKVANVAPPSKETVVKCQTTLNGALSPIRFKTARADLTPEGRSALDKMAQAIKQCPGVSVRVEGHTDSDGDPAFNQELSEARAKSVTAYLASVGVDAARLKPKGFGETKPIASNDDDAGKARNRRIDFVVDEH